MQKFIVGENDANQRLDKYLTKMFPNLPQSMMYKSIRKKDIKLNGKRCEISSRLATGDILELYIKDEFLETKQSKPTVYSVVPVLNVLYEDNNIILIDKKPGISVHSDLTEDKNDDLVTQIQAYLYLKGEYDPENKSSFTPSLCNRIDKNTGGIVIAAKNATALRTINQKIKNREISKKYLCIVHGKLDKKSATLNAYHIKNSKLNRAFIFDEPQEGARKITTKYKVLKEKNNLSLVEVDLLTGRTHQIRAHFAYIGHPLAGDTKYGTNKQNQHLGFKHQALYSYKIKFNFTSPSPLDYLKGKEFTVERVDFAEDF